VREAAGEAEAARNELDGPPLAAGAGPAAPRSRLLSTGAWLVPLALLALLVTRLGVNVPYWDEWEFVTILQKSAAHTLQVSDLWAQHNEHRLFFPQIILLGLSRLTHWNIRVELVANLVLSVAAFALLAFLLRRTIQPYGTAAHLLALAAFAWLVFSPVAWENWLWGWELSWFLNTLAVVGAAAVLSAWPASRPVWPGVVCAIVASVIASYSLGAGLLVWLACLVFFISDRRLRPYLPLWLAGAATTVALFLHGFANAGTGIELRFVLSHPVAYAHYVLGYLGAPFSLDPSVAPIFGFALLAVFAGAVGWLCLRSPQSLGRAVVWVAVGSYAVLASLATGLARVWLGAEGVASRYTTLSVLLPLATVATVLSAAGTYRTRPRASRPVWVGVQAALGLALVPLVAGGWMAGWRAMDNRHAMLVQGLACLERARGPGDACLTTMYPGPELEFARLQFLQKAGLTGVARAR